MPTYEFRCSSCDYVFEERHPITNPPKSRPCLECGEKAKRLFGSGSMVVFKGTGFYATDYKKPRCTGFVEKSKCIPDTPDNRKRAAQGEI